MMKVHIVLLCVLFVNCELWWRKELDKQTIFEFMELAYGTLNRSCHHMDNRDKFSALVEAMQNAKETAKLTDVCNDFGLQPLPTLELECTDDQEMIMIMKVSIKPENIDPCFYYLDFLPDGRRGLAIYSTPEEVAKDGPRFKVVRLFDLDYEGLKIPRFQFWGFGFNYNEPHDSTCVALVQSFVTDQTSTKEDSTSKKNNDNRPDFKKDQNHVYNFPTIDDVPKIFAQPLYKDPATIEDMSVELKSVKPKRKSSQYSCKNLTKRPAIHWIVDDRTFFLCDNVGVYANVRYSIFVVDPTKVKDYNIDMNYQIYLEFRDVFANSQFFSSETRTNPKFECGSKLGQVSFSYTDTTTFTTGQANTFDLYFNAVKKEIEFKKPHTTLSDEIARDFERPMPSYYDPNERQAFNAIDKRQRDLKNAKANKKKAFMKSYNKYIEELAPLRKIQMKRIMDVVANFLYNHCEKFYDKTTWKQLQDAFLSGNDAYSCRTSQAKNPLDDELTCYAMYKWEGRLDIL